MLLNSHISACTRCLAQKVCGLVQSTWGTSQGEDKVGARDKILNTKVARRACAGRAPGKHSPCVVFCYPPPPLCKLRPCPSYSRHRDRINLVPNFNSVPNIVQPHKTWVSQICQSNRVMDTFVVSVCPLEPTPFLSPLLQVMILVTLMMLPLNCLG